jgi:hypothetical protein
MKHLETKFNLNTDTTESFNGHKGGIWIRDDIANKETEYYNYAEGTSVENNILNKFLAKNDWFAEPYDSETIMLYPIY